jgi:hypothetical protein
MTKFFFFFTSQTFARFEIELPLRREGKFSLLPLYWGVNESAGSHSLTLCWRGPRNNLPIQSRPDTNIPEGSWFWPYELACDHTVLVYNQTPRMWPNKYANKWRCQHQCDVCVPLSGWYRGTLPEFREANRCVQFSVEQVTIYVAMDCVDIER